MKRKIITLCTALFALGIHAQISTPMWENFEGSSLVLENITYEGTGSAELPVDVSISYELDGQAIEPEELAGKSGQLKIRFDYKNKTTQTIKVDGKEEQD